MTRSVANYTIVASSKVCYSTLILQLVDRRRMYLEKIELQGFKSFADRTILEFQAPKDNRNSVTIIVGPNGSGKSNTSDAIKWVLGEQSMKNIRGKRSEDVIFSGSEKRGRLGFAEVSLYLNNEDGQAKIDYSQLVITRRLYRDGQSEYLINKNPVRLIDIQLLIARAHLGTRSFSIISQGMIDSVLLATPLERKSFFDEAVGVKEHQIKRNQALNKLERSEENLHQAGLLLKEISPQLRSLTRQVKKLEQREEVQAALRNYQQEYYHRIWSELTKTKALQKTQVTELQKQLDTLSEGLTEKRSQLEILEKSESRGQIFTDLQTKLQTKNSERNRLLREMTVIKGRLEIDLEKQGQLNLAWLYRQEEEVSTRQIDLEKDVAALRKEHKAITSEWKLKSDEVKSLSDKIESLNITIDRLKNELKNEVSKGPLTQIGRKLKDLYVVFQKFSRKINTTTPDDVKTLQDQAESIQAQLNELSDYVSNEAQGLTKEEDVKLSESQELWQLQQDISGLIERHQRLAPELTQLQIKGQVHEEKLRLAERDHEQVQAELARIKSDLESKKQAKDGKIDKSKIQEQQEELEQQIAKIDKDVAAYQEKLDKFNEEEEAKQSRVFQLEREYQDIQTQVNRHQQKQHSVQVELTRTETKLENIETEIKRELGDPTLVHKRPENTETDLETLPTERLFSQIEKYKYQLELIGGIDPETVTEYEQVKERHDFLAEQLDDLEKTIGHLEEVIQELDKTIVKQFDRAFNVINKEFERYFQILFGGGRAKLIKILPDDPADAEAVAGEESPETEEEKMAAAMMAEPEKEEMKKRSKKYRRSDIKGIDIYASPAGKKLSTIAMLSGGERSLTSLALIAAIIYHNPSPFILMDEVDAALDEANSQRMAKVLSNLREKSQFIIITHNRTIMNIADTIYGVTMGNDGVSKLLSVKLEDVDQHTTRM